MPTGTYCKWLQNPKQVNGVRCKRDIAIQERVDTSHFLSLDRISHYGCSWLNATSWVKAHCQVASWRQRMMLIGYLAFVSLSCQHGLASLAWPAMASSSSYHFLGMCWVLPTGYVPRKLMDDMPRPCPLALINFLGYVEA